MNWNGLFLAFAILASSVSASVRATDTTEPTTQPFKIHSSKDEACEYRGDLGDKLAIGMTLRFSPNGDTATGCYFYYKYCKDIRIGATISGRAIVIREFDADGKQTGKFVGAFSPSDPRHSFSPGADLGESVIIGNWSKPDGSKKQPFYLDEESQGIWRDGTSRYADAGFDDEQAANRFVSRFRQAVLDADPQAVPRMIGFPITVTIDGKRVPVRSAKDFLRQYNLILTSTFIERIRRAAPCHMFSNFEGVMLGDGEVWLGLVQRGADSVPAIITINNDIDLPIR